VLTFLRRLVIMLWGFQLRLLKSLLELLVWIDQGVGLLLCIPFYLILGHPKPNADETISSVVGRYATLEYRWALAAEWIIDRLFFIPQGCRLGHCRKHIEYDETDWDEALLLQGMTEKDNIT
jgi:hypothetical protein